MKHLSLRSIAPVTAVLVASMLVASTWFAPASAGEGAAVPAASVFARGTLAVQPADKLTMDWIVALGEVTAAGSRTINIALTWSFGNIVVEKRFLTRTLSSSSQEPIQLDAADMDPAVALALACEALGIAESLPNDPARHGVAPAIGVATSIAPPSGVAWGEITAPEQVLVAATVQ